MSGQARLKPVADVDEEPVIRDVYQALAYVMRRVGAITKDRTNEIQRFQFRGIDDVYNELHNLLAEAGLIALPKLLDHQQIEKPTAKGGVSLHHVVKVAYQWMAEDGSRMEEPAIVMGEAADTGDKGVGKAQQYAFKTFLLQSFLIPTAEDKDPDPHTTEWRGPQQPEPKAKRAEPRQGKPAVEPQSAGVSAPRPDPTPQQAFDMNLKLLKDCNTVAELGALKMRGSKWMSAEMVTELRNLKAERLALLQGKTEATPPDPMNLRMADAYTRLVKLDREKANACLRETPDLAKRVELLENALTYAAQQAAQAATTALSTKDYEDMK